jgi:hypothetical protein
MRANGKKESNTAMVCGKAHKAIRISGNGSIVKRRDSGFTLGKIWISTRVCGSRT